MQKHLSSERTDPKIKEKIMQRHKTTGKTAEHETQVKTKVENNKLLGISHYTNLLCLSDQKPNLTGTK